MANPAPLGEFEVVILLAVLHLENGDTAFGSTIRNDIEERSGRHVSRGSVYITLDRLEDKGLLTSRLAPGSTKRAGRAKRLFRVTAAGRKAVRHSLTLVTRMQEGLELVLGDLT